MTQSHANQYGLTCLTAIGYVLRQMMRCRAIPRNYRAIVRNVVLLVTPSKDGLELALARVRYYLAWEAVRDDVKKQQKDGDVDPARMQDLGDVMPKLLELRTKSNTPLQFHIQIEMGDGTTTPTEETVQKANAILKNVKEGLEFRS